MYPECSLAERTRELHIDVLELHKMSAALLVAVLFFADVCRWSKYFGRLAELDSPCAGLKFEDQTRDRIAVQ